MRAKSIIIVTLLLLFCLTKTKLSAQFYGSVANSSTDFYYYDMTANTWSLRAPFPSGPDWGHGLVYNGTYIYATRGGSSNLFWRYDLISDTWTAMANVPATVERGGKPLYTSGDDIYLMRGGAGAEFYKYDITANTWTTLASMPAACDEGGSLTWDGGDFIYAFRGTAVEFYRYSISGDIWTTMAPLPEIADDGASLLYLAPYIYGIPSGQDASFYRYDIAANTWSPLASLTSPFLFHDGSFLTSDGTDIYSMGGGDTGNAGYNTLYKYTVATDTWSSVSSHPGVDPPDPISEGASLVFAGSICAAPVVAASIQKVTCTAGVANSNGTITLNTFNSNAKRVGYSAGSTYTGPAFATASVIGAAPFTVVNTLSNPTVPQPYIMRVYCDDTEYTDILLVLQPQLCRTSDLSLSVSPSTQTGSEGELLTFSFVLTNTGPDAAENVKVKLPVPSNSTLMATIPSLGAYDADTKMWTAATVPVGTHTFTMTVKVN